MYTGISTNLMVEDVNSTVLFYEDILGFSVVASMPLDNPVKEFAILAKDGLSLMIQERTSMAAEYPILDTEAVKASITLFIRVDDFDKLCGEIQTKHPLYTDPHTTFYGTREFAIADPNGYILTFAEQLEG